MIQTPVNGFFRQNFFGVANLAALICGLAYFSGQLQTSVSAQNQALASVQHQLRQLEGFEGQTVQNTDDISRVRANEGIVSQQLLQISGQISALSQWAKHHRDNPIGGTP